MNTSSPSQTLPAMGFASGPAAASRAAPQLLFACTLVLAAASCRSGPGPVGTERERVASLVRHERFGAALELAERIHGEHPGDPEAAALHRDTSVAWLLARGREATFDDRDEEALSLLEQALEVDPGSRPAAIWLDKTHSKIATRWVRTGMSAHSDGNLEAAAQAFETALAHVPGHPTAMDGLGQVLIQINYRLGLGEDYYNDGVRAMSDFYLRRARRSFAVAHKYTPANERAERRRGNVEESLSEERLVIAQGLETDARYAAAFNEYRLALALDPDNAAAAAGRARMEKEAAAARFLREAEMMVVRGRFDEADELLAQAGELTTLQVARVDELLAGTTDARLEALYVAALNLEKDQLYVEAAAAYERLLEQTEYFKDARARVETLREYVRLAGEYYARAEAETDPQERLRHYRAIAQFWADYRDVRERIRQLESP